MQRVALETAEVVLLYSPGTWTESIYIGRGLISIEGVIMSYELLLEFVLPLACVVSYILGSVVQGYFFSNRR